MPDKVKLVTSIHVGEEDKPNEDCVRVDSDRRIALLADGVTRRRLQDGSYPANTSCIAPVKFVETAFNLLCEPSVSLFEAFRLGNGAVGLENERLGINRDTVDFLALDYLATTGCCLRITEREGELYAQTAFIGDPVILHFPVRSEPVLVTRDQLADCHRYTKPRFARIPGDIADSDEATCLRLQYQRSFVRNRRSARNPLGEDIGYGTITGEIGAEHFIAVNEFRTSVGDRLVLASDAIRALMEPGDENDASSYRQIWDVARTWAIDSLPGEIIRLIRTAEMIKRTRSDDATVVAYEVG